MRNIPSPIIGLICILGSWFGFPNPAMHLPPASLLLPAMLFILAGRAETWRRAFRCGYLVGGAALAAPLYWVALPVHNYGNVPWILAGLCPVGVGLVLGLFTGFFTLASHLGIRRLPPVWGALMAGLAWGVSEYLRSILFTGFPWNVLPAAFAPWPSTIQLLSFIGVYGLATFLATVSCLLFLPLTRRTAHFTGPVLGVLLIAALVVHGHFALEQPLPPGPEADIALVQGNIDQSHKWVPEYQKATIERYATLTRKAAQGESPDLVIWPETAIPFFFQEQSILSDAVRDLARELDSPLLVGAPGYRFTDPPDTYILYNNAYLIDRYGEDAGLYGKEHLVPFGEYIPLRSILFFLEKMVEGIGSFQPGLSTAPIEHGNLALGMLICYESIFTSLTNRRISDHANLLVNISNDAWFGRSSAPRQHLNLSALRAVEQGRWLVRGTNTGISAFVDPKGRILEESDLFRPAYLRRTVQLLNHKTVYHSLYFAVAPIIIGLFAGLLFTALLRPEQPRN